MFRIIAQDHFTREFLHWDLPLDNVVLTYALSGPNLLQGKLSTEIPSMLELDPPLIPNRTWLYVEEDGIIRGAYIMTPVLDDNSANTRMIEAEGFSVYPYWVYYEGPAITAIQIDPADIFFYLWSHCQSFPDGDLNVNLNDINTPIRIGTPSNSYDFKVPGGTQYQFSGGPYVLNYWDVTNVGDEIEKICKDTPIEFIERFVWNDNKTDVILNLEVGYPRVGTRRTDLAFREGENLTQVIPSYQENNDEYASDVIVIGAGNGPGAIRASAQSRIGRLRKVVVIQNQDIITQERAQSIADYELKKLGNTRYKIDHIVVDCTHTNAPWGSFNAGDDIYIEGRVIYEGTVSGWYRITEYNYDPYSRTAILSIVPSESFSYGVDRVDPIGDLPTSGTAIIKTDGTVPTDPDKIKSLQARLQGCVFFNQYGCPPGMAWVYKITNPNVTYGGFLVHIVPITQAIGEDIFIIGRTDGGNIITGDDVLLFGMDGFIGIPAKTSSTTTRITTTPLPTPVAQAKPATPTKTSLMSAGEELLARYNRGGQIYEDFSFNGCSANLAYWNDHIGDMYWDQGGKSLGMKGFLTAVANGSRT